jgi:hypothetical protein
VNEIDTEHAQFRCVASEEVHGLRAGGVGHAIVGLVTVGESLFEGRDEVGLGGFGFFDLYIGTFLAERL